MNGTNWYWAPLAASILLLGPAAAADPLPDRSGLSYEDNVTINTACFTAHKQGNSAFEACVQAQLAQVKDHPQPDRTSLPASTTAAILRDCDYLRRTGIAAYNDCLTKEAAARAPADEAATDATGTPKLSQVFAAVAHEKPQAIPVSTASLPRPSAVLPHRPNAIARQALSPAELYKKVERSIFVVFAAHSVADARSGDVVQGSAVAISDHLLLTNCHVVMNRPEVRIRQDHTIAVAKLVASNTTGDACVIRTDDISLTPITGVRSYDDLSVGERAFAVGTPRGLERTLSEGLVSALRHLGQRNVIQTSAPISHGSSGGGLFDDRGNLIGITSAGVEDAQNLDFAIAASDFWQ